MFGVVVLYGAWRQVLQSLPCLSSWAPFLHPFGTYELEGAFGWDRVHLHYSQRNFIPLSQYFFNTLKTRVVFCLNATNFSAYIGVCYI